eukprot:scaffold35468_cov237-Amphora_coffeaeformis.AAC.1
MPKRKDDFDFDFDFDNDTVVSHTSVAETPEKKKKKAEKSSSGTTLSNNQNSLLANLMSYHMRGTEGASFKKCATDLNFMTRTKSWCKAWSDLLDMGSIEPCIPGGAKTTADHRLTEGGIAQASTPEYEEFIKDKNFVATTNQDHQGRIKKRLSKGNHGPRCLQIVDLYLEHGALTRMELCGILGMRSGTHSVSYALKELKEMGILDGTGSEKLRLSDKFFLDPSVDRPTHVSNQDAIWMLVHASKYAGEYEYKEDGQIKHNKHLKTTKSSSSTTTTTTTTKKTKVKEHPESISSKTEEKDANDNHNIKKESEELEIISSLDPEAKTAVKKEEV